jgi:hypothetical protein
MQSAHLEKIFYHYLETRPEISSQVKPRFFENPEIRLAHQIRTEFTKKFSKSPTAAQLKEIVKIKNLEEELSKEKIDALYEVNLKEYDPEWLQTSTEAWIEFKTLDTSVMDLVHYMKTTKVTEENIKEVVQTAKSIISERNKIDFKFDEGLNFFDPNSHRQLRSETFDTGYPFFNTCLGGGYKAKTLVCFAGIPKVGKSVYFDSYITIRNKKTGVIEKIKIGEFHERVKTKFINSGNLHISRYQKS